MLSFCPDLMVNTDSPCSYSPYCVLYVLRLSYMYLVRVSGLRNVGNKYERLYNTDADVPCALRSTPANIARSRLEATRAVRAAGCAVHCCSILLVLEGCK